MTKVARKRRSYTEDFKRDAVALVTEAVWLYRRKRRNSNSISTNLPNTARAFYS